MVFHHHSSIHDQGLVGHLKYDTYVARAQKRQTKIDPQRGILK